MTSLTFLKLVERIDDLREEIEELQRQEEKLQEVYDFSDFIETHDLITNEIVRLQEQLREQKLLLSNSKETDSEDSEDVEEEIVEEE